MSRPLSERDAGAVLAGAATVGAESGASEGPVEAAAVLSPYIPIATESSHSYESCALSTTKESADTIHCAVYLATLIYKSKDLANAPEGYIGGSRELVEAERLLAPWATIIAYPNSEGQDIFVVFQGSANAVDWLTNACSVGRVHSSCNNVLVHSGYVAELGDARSRNSLYSKLVSRLDKMVKRDRTRRVIACGHSKGGGMAQLFIDALFYDDSCHLAAPHGGDTKKYKLGLLRAITIAAPMVFASSRDDIKHLGSQELFHNFIIKGDPVPVIQPLLLYNWSAVVNMGVIGVTVNVLRGSDHVAKVSDVLKLYRPVGSIYVATVSCTKKINAPCFRRVESREYSEDLSKWQCVTAPKFTESRHDQQLYFDVICREIEPCSARRRTGLFVENETEHDIEVYLTAADQRDCSVLSPWKTETRVTIAAGSTEHIESDHGIVNVFVVQYQSKYFGKAVDNIIKLITLGYVNGSGFEKCQKGVRADGRIAQVSETNHGLDVTINNLHACFKLGEVKVEH
jgi:hypothetical protein